MTNLIISPYTVEDNEAALSLEEQCVQGKSLSLKFRRQTFHARSEVYDNYRIVCARVGEKLVGIVAGTVKVVRLHGEAIRAAYIYDLRVHPEHRKYGLAKRLVDELLDDIGKTVDCIYTLIAGQNERALGLARRSFGAKVVLPLTYAVLPVYKKLMDGAEHRFTNSSEVHETYLTRYRAAEFVPEFNGAKLVGSVASISLSDPEKGGCSIWTNESLLAEQVVRVPAYFRFFRAVTSRLRPFLELPTIPKQGDLIQSWFLFDFYAMEKRTTRNLISAVNNFALSRERKFLYILMQSDDPTLALIRTSGYRAFTFPYVFLAKGQKIPAPFDKVYIDVRDL